MACDDNHGQFDLAFQQLVLKFQTIHVGHANIDDQTSVQLLQVRRKKCDRRLECLDGVLRELQQDFERIPHILIVVDNVDSGTLCHFPRSIALPMGRLSLKVAPCGVLAASHNRPPCASAIVRQMLKPIPMPRSFVVTTG